MRNALATSLFLAATLFCGASAKADTLTGAAIDGTLTAVHQGLTVSTPFSSSAVADPGSFSGSLYDEAFGQTFDITVDLTADGFSVDVTSPESTANLSGGTEYGITLSGLPSFVSGFELSSYSCDVTVDEFCTTHGNGLTSNTFSNSAVTLDFANLVNGQTYVFSDGLAPAATPEPSSLVLLGTGLLGVVGVARRRFV